MQNSQKVSQKFPPVMQGNEFCIKKLQLGYMSKLVEHQCAFLSHLTIMQCGFLREKVIGFVLES